MSFARICILIIISFQSFGQAKSVFDLLKTERKKADKHFHKKEYSSAAQIYSRIHERNNDDQKVILQLARSNRLLNNYEESINWYQQVKDSTILSTQDIHNIADMLAGTDPEAAINWHKKLLRRNPTDKSAQMKLESLENLSVLYEDSLCYEISLANINTTDHDFATAIMEKQLILLSSRPHTTLIKKINTADQTYFLEMYAADWIKEDSLGEVKKFSNSINTGSHEGPATIYNKGKSILFTRTNVKRNNLGLYSANRKDNESEWKNIRPLPFNNHNYSISHPCFDEATQTLYFVSDNPAGFGGADLYKSRLVNGKWTPSINLGEGVNTIGNEVFPAIANGELFFSSDGYGGLGGLDLFSVNPDSLKNPQNLGYPINSHADDFSLIFSNNGKSGFFSSNRKDGIGKDDIYYFESKKKRGAIQVKEKLNRKDLAYANIKITENQKLISESFSSESGNFSFKLKPGKTYTIECSMDGFKKVDTTFSTPVALNDDALINFKLDRKNKAYIKTYLRDSIGNILISDSLVIYNKDLEITEVVIQEDDSSFIYQVDPEYNYILSSKSGTKGGYVTTGKFEKKRGSSVNYVDIIATEFKIKPIKMSVKDQNGAPLVDANVRLKNLITGETSNIHTDLNGYATINCPTYQNFSINVSCTEFENELIINDLRTTPYKELKFVLYD